MPCHHIPDLPSAAHSLLTSICPNLLSSQSGVQCVAQRTMCGSRGQLPTVAAEKGEAGSGEAGEGGGEGEAGEGKGGT